MKWVLFIGAAIVLGLAATSAVQHRDVFMQIWRVAQTPAEGW